MTLDLDVSFTQKQSKDETEGNEGNVEDIIIPGLGGPHAFWRILRGETGITKVSLDTETEKIVRASQISPSSIDDKKPEMSAYEITDTLIKTIKKNSPDMIILNFANGDMVGHTGNYDAAIKAVETIDTCLNKIISKVDTNKYTIIVTADHGNCEVMINSDGSVNTQHTTNLVPFIVLDKNLSLRDGKLGDIASTILDIMNLEIPEEMTGKSLIIRK